MKLYHYYRSSASYRVRIALALKQLNWEPISVHLGNGEHREDAYVRLSPSRTVPLLMTEEATVSQSLAIIEYLDEIHPHIPMLPPGPLDRAFVREIALDIACEIHPLNNTRVLTFLTGLGLSDKQRSAWYRHWTESGLLVVEQKLQRSGKAGRFCFGDTPSMADCVLIPQIFNAKRMNCDLTPLQKIHEVFDACMALPAFADTQPSAFDPANHPNKP